MERSLEARLWRLIPSPGWTIRILLLVLVGAALLLIGRGAMRLVLIPIVAVLLWLLLDVGFSASLVHAYRGLARAHRALLHTAPFPKGPRVEWTEHAGPTPTAWCLVGPIADGFGGRVARTRMTVQSLAGLHAALEITTGAAPSGGGTAIAPPRDAPELRVAVPWGHEPGNAEDLLDGYTAAQVRALAQRAGSSGVRIVVLMDRVMVDVGRVLRRSSGLQQLVQTTLAIRDRARTLAASGRVVFEAATVTTAVAAPDDAPPTCPVCAAPTAGARLVTCDTCHTPHHADCFEWTGACGVFQCAGKAAATV